MIDGIKTKFIDIPNQSLLDWRLSVSERNSDYTESKKIKYKGLIFNRKDGKFFMEGSLHTFFNDGLHNYNDFTYTDLVNTVNQIKMLFGINPEKVLLSNVEFGVNIILPYPPEKIINSLVIHKGEAFNKIPYCITKGTGAGVEVIHKNYIIKIYDKGAQNDLKQSILRIEIKAIKMAFFQYYNIPIQTLNDLLNIDNLKALGEILVIMVNESLIVDPAILIQENIIESDKLILANGSNANYWKQLNPNSKNYPKGNKDPEYKRKRKKYYKEYERFENVLKKYNSDSKKQIIKLIGDKLTDLLTITENKLTNLKELPETIKQGYKLTDQKQAKGTNSPLVYSVNLYPAINRVCKTCSKDINNKRKEAKFCCKKCKNDFTNPILNPKNNLNSRIKRIESYPVFFNVTDFLNPQLKTLLTKQNSIYNYNGY